MNSLEYSEKDGLKITIAGVVLSNDMLGSPATIEVTSEQEPPKLTLQVDLDMVNVKDLESMLKFVTVYGDVLPIKEKK